MEKPIVGPYGQIYLAPGGAYKKRLNAKGREFADQWMKEHKVLLPLFRKVSPRLYDAMVAIGLDEDEIEANCVESMVKSLTSYDGHTVQFKTYLANGFKNHFIHHLVRHNRRMERLKSCKTNCMATSSDESDVFASMSDDGMSLDGKGDSVQANVMLREKVRKIQDAVENAALEPRELDAIKDLFYRPHLQVAYTQRRSKQLFSLRKKNAFKKLRYEMMCRGLNHL